VPAMTWCVRIGSTMPKQVKFALLV